MECQQIKIVLLPFEETLLLLSPASHIGQGQLLRSAPLSFLKVGSLNIL